VAFFVCTVRVRYCYLSWLAASDYLATCIALEVGDVSNTEADDGELAVFIRDTLTQIAVGLYRSHDVFEAMGGRVNPAAYNLPARPDAMVIPVDNDNQGYLQFVEFDIAVTREAGSDGSIRGGIRVLSLGAGGERSNSSAESNVSRVRFSIPVALPNQLSPTVEGEQRRLREEQERRLADAMQRMTPLGDIR